MAFVAALGLPFVPAHANPGKPPGFSIEANWTTATGKTKEKKVGVGGAASLLVKLVDASGAQVTNSGSAIVVGLEMKGGSGPADGAAEDYVADDASCTISTGANGCTKLTIGSGGTLPGATTASGTVDLIAHVTMSPAKCNADRFVCGVASSEEFNTAGSIAEPDQTSVVRLLVNAASENTITCTNVRQNLGKGVSPSAVVCDFLDQFGAPVTKPSPTDIEQKGQPEDSAIPTASRDNGTWASPVDYDDYAATGSTSFSFTPTGSATNGVRIWCAWKDTNTSTKDTSFDTTDAGNGGNCAAAEASLAAGGDGTAPNTAVWCVSVGGPDEPKCPGKAGVVPPPGTEKEPPEFTAESGCNRTVVLDMTGFNGDDTHGVEAIDPEGQDVSLSSSELPVWLDFEDFGDGTGELSFVVPALEDITLDAVLAFLTDLLLGSDVSLFATNESDQTTECSLLVRYTIFDFGAGLLAA